MEPKRVLIVTGRMHYGGMESMIINFFRHMDHEKVVFDFLLNYEEPGVFDDEIRKMGGNIYYAPRLFLKNTFKYIKTLNQFFKEHKEFEIVHGHLTSVGLVYLTIAKIHGVKTTIIHAHNTSIKKRLKWIVERALMAPLKFCADYYFACSNAAATYCFGKGILRKPNYRMIKNGIIVDKFTFNETVRNQKRQELGLTDKFVIGNVGRFVPQKNHTGLIEIFKEVHKIDKNSVLLLVGDGPEIKNIIEIVDNYQLNDAVKFLGMRDDTNELLQAMDLFLLPSFYEGLPVVSIEAQASGLPCVISDTVTDECDITELCEFISLNESPALWANHILHYKDNYVREDMHDRITTAGYNVKDTALWLQEFYLNS